MILEHLLVHNKIAYTEHPGVFYVCAMSHSDKGSFVAADAIAAIEVDCGCCTTNGKMVIFNRESPLKAMCDRETTLLHEIGHAVLMQRDKYTTFATARDQFACELAAWLMAIKIGDSIGIAVNAVVALATMSILATSMMANGVKPTIIRKIGKDVKKDVDVFFKEHGDEILPRRMRAGSIKRLTAKVRRWSPFKIMDDIKKIKGAIA